MVQTLQCLRDGKLQQAMGDLAPSSLLAQQEVLRTLALLLTRDDSDVNEAVTLYLAAASKNEHFREKVGGQTVATEPDACWFSISSSACVLLWTDFLPLVRL